VSLKARDHFARFTPTNSSHLRKARTILSGFSGSSIGLLAIRSAYSGRPNSGDDLLARLRRQRERHVLHRRAGIEIALVIGHRPACFGVSTCAMMSSTTASFGRSAMPLGTHMKKASDTQWKPFSVLDLGFLRHDAERARIDVPAGGRDDDVARAFAELLHRRAGAGRIILDVLAELLQIGPGLVPALRPDPAGPCRRGCRAGPS
jgi:uncharacterized protein YceK